MIIKEIPTSISPPKLSIHWSLPWTDEKYSTEQKGLCAICGLIKRTEFRKFRVDGKPYKKAPKKLGVPCTCNIATDITEDTNITYDAIGNQCNNWVGARSIHYQNEKLRIFPNEFSKVSAESMRIYCADEGSHVLVRETIDTSTNKNFDIILDTDMRFVRDAALVDGCDNNMATLVAAGMDVSIQDAEFPAIGWYKYKQKYADMFCR